MSTNFPTGLDTLTNPGPLDTQGDVSHSDQHANANDAIEALQAKVGIDGSSVQTSFDYKLGEITGSDQAVGKSATQTLSNKTLGVGTSVVIGSDAVGDTYYRGGGGSLTRLAVGSSGQYLKSNGTNPTWGGILSADVDGAGAVMNSDTSTASMAFVVDEDNMSSDDDTKVPTQQSVKKYVDDGLGAISVPDTVFDVDEGADWYPFELSLPENNAGGNGWQVLNALSVTSYAGLVQINNSGGNYTRTLCRLPSAFGNTQFYDNDHELKIVFYLSHLTVSNNLEFGISTDGSNFGSGQELYFNLDGTSGHEIVSRASSATSVSIAQVTKNNWNKYAIHYRPGVDVRFYINGTQVGSTITTNLPASGPYRVKIQHGQGVLNLGKIKVALRSS